MRIISPEATHPAQDMDVHTIDIWLSPSRRQWIVQRLNGMGDPIGPSHRCRSRAEATACLEDWLRRHPETHLATPHARSRRRLARTSKQPPAR